MVPVTLHTFKFGLVHPLLVRQLVLTCQIIEEERGRLTKNRHASSVTVPHSSTDHDK